MSNMLLTGGGPGDGLFPSQVIVKALADEALTKGDICQFDFQGIQTATSGDGAVTSKIPGNVQSPFYRVRDPDATSTGGIFPLNSYIYGVALESIAARGTGKVMLRGIVNMNTSTDTIRGSGLVGATSGAGVLASGVTNLKILAIALEADTSGFADVWFDGINGFGSDVNLNVTS
jgi:hypothetical protein